MSNYSASTNTGYSCFSKSTYGVYVGCKGCAFKPNGKDSEVLMRDGRLTVSTLYRQHYLNHQEAQLL